MHLAEPIVSSWKARLALDFAFQNEKTVLAGKSHDGPLVVQKPLYPEGGELCHAIVVHPPGGIAGGDELALSATVGQKAAALLTTPGATKWYRSAGAWATQSVVFDVKGALEWLPQESIIFEGARAALETEIRLAPGARYIGWEILCLGRTGSGERFTRGECALRSRLRIGQRTVWLEQGRIEAGGTRMHARAGLGGHSVSGTLIAAGAPVDDALLAACRRLVPGTGRGAVTRLPELLVARVLGDSSETAKRYFTQLWALLRPRFIGRDAVEPRIWRT